MDRKMPSEASDKLGGGDPSEGTRYKDRPISYLPLSSPQSQILLAALRNVIIPLVHAAVPNSHDQDLDNEPIGPEAEDFLLALQKYISSFIRNRSQIHNQRMDSKAIRMQTVPEVPILPISYDVDRVGSNRMLKDEAPPAPLETKDLGMSKVSSPNQIVNSLQFEGNLTSYSTTHDLEKHSRQLNELLADLRTHIYKNLPTRLLSFDKRDDSDSLVIALLNREELYSYLANKVTADFMSRKKIVMKDERLNMLKKTRYAILSHAWLRPATREIAYEDWKTGIFDSTQAGYLKLSSFCEVATDDHDLTLGWSDTVCIDKTSSADLDESIRSMYRWYKNASMCIIYLAETATFDKMECDPWFTRGWTLQELLAPKKFKFYGKNWKQLIENDSLDKWNPDIQHKIELATSITKEELANPLSTPIARRMQWGALRQVTRGEDIAYSLMGICETSIPITYGEGEELAYYRLLKELLNTPKEDILDLFNWGGDYASSVCDFLPSSPKAYLQRCPSANLRRTILTQPLTLTHIGFGVSGLVLPAALAEPLVEGFTPKGDYFSTTDITLISPDSESMYNRTIALALEPIKSYNILDVKAFDPAIPVSFRDALLVLNCTEFETHINVPIDCFAVAIQYRSADALVTPVSPIFKAATAHPIFFRLHSKVTDSKNLNGSYSIDRSELEYHGMQFPRLYF